MSPTDTIPKPTVGQRKAVDEAWKLLPEKFQKYVQELDRGTKTEDILNAASLEVRSDVSPESIARTARDRLKATIASEAYKRAETGSLRDKGFFVLLLDSIKEDMQTDFGANRKEQER